MSGPAAMNQTLAGNVVQSVQAALAAIGHLEQALDRAGFADGAPTYERMAEVLVGQRLWIESEGIDGPVEQFETLGATATRVFAMLQPYTDAMRRLSVLAPDDHERLRRQVHAAVVARGRRPVSATTIARELRTDRAAVDEVLDALAGEGLVVVRGSGGRRTYLATEHTSRSQRTTRSATEEGSR